MSLTGRIRMYLVVIALLPPALMMAVVYFYSYRQEELAYRQNAVDDLEQVELYHAQFEERFTTQLESVLDSDWFSRVRHAVRSGNPGQISCNARQFDLDFLEVLDSTGRVLASSHRPGLIGELIDKRTQDSAGGPVRLVESVEYDITGRHASMSGLTNAPGPVQLYGGWYVEQRLQPTADRIIRGQTVVVFVEDESEVQSLSAMNPSTLYGADSKLRARVTGNEQAGYFVIANFEPTEIVSVFASFINVISLVALASVLVAVAVGMYISGRAKREIDNLVDAFGRVAGGDLNTPVMAFEEGEFAQLADSFSEMMRKLDVSQKQLATTEKIAAWQTMARKIAHEIKNPLTPIAISADDLRRSFQEKLPGFDQTLNDNTKMIKEETTRLAKLLDQFVGFARMSPPSLTPTPPVELIRSFETLYADKIRSEALRVTYRTERKTISVDADQMRQVLVNLVKNGFESGDDARVEVVLSDSDNGIKITVSDNGPGFTDDALEQKFEPYVSTKQGGSGLGLVICQRIVLDHGGTIKLANRKQGGAEVTISLPQR